ncbi:hypothetical protein GR702_11700 [Novosphingobium sp. FGD1]|uniref:Uncharacterized protein n=1 Tax=Novosphingobium silvae TaxID=2692619 RepID=A0A7X4GGW5_9SPHN|nr:hypothetical protein [Novosphingobium silvae]MYL98428.1 hypothetical protein [Novosphingobium silvae]
MDLFIEWIVDHGSAVAILDWACVITRIANDQAGEMLRLLVFPSKNPNIDRYIFMIIVQRVALLGGSP